MSYSAKETFENGFHCDYCITGGEDEDMACTCLKDCGERRCKVGSEE